MYSRRTILLAAISLGILGASPAAAEEFLTLATTTSTENSGLLAYLHPDFEKQTGIRVKVVAKGTGASLQLAREGNADVVLAHARSLEDKFMADGFGAIRRDVMYNDFILVGPKEDPAKVRGLASAVEAMKRIAAAKQPFVSRGDDSGTHIKEQEIWQASGLALKTEKITAVVDGKEKTFGSVHPQGDWYLSIGQGMGKTLILSTEKRAYTLADRGTYYAFALVQPPKTDLAILCEGDRLLANPYGVIAVNPQKHPHVKFEAAKKYVDWITSPATQKKIAEFQIQGKSLFFPGTVPANR
jgi:tungstate transport system substrate-binding protein